MLVSAVTPAPVRVASTAGSGVRLDGAADPGALDDEVVDPRQRTELGDGPGDLRA